jgi:hypothetical protein
MNSSKPVYVHNPCTLKWDDLSGRGCTRLCSKCQNEVHDLTHENDQAIKMFMISKKGKICARVTHVQVQGVFRPHASNLAKACMVFFFGFTLMGQASAKTDSFNRKPNAETVYVNPRGNLHPIDSTNVISGVVKGRDDLRPLEGVKVMLNETSLVTETDKKGVFKIIVPQDLKLSTYTIKISAVGYQSIDFIWQNDQSMLIVLEPEVIWIGEVRLPWFQHIWWSLKAPFMKKS